MNNLTELIQLILFSASSAWIWHISTPTINLKFYLQSKLPFLNHKYVNELIHCLVCSSWWIIFSILIYNHCGFFTAIGGASLGSLLIAFIDGHFKVRL